MTSAANDQIRPGVWSRAHASLLAATLLSVTSRSSSSPTVSRFGTIGRATAASSSVDLVGLVTALEPLMQACAGVWVAHGSGTADRIVVDGRDGLDGATRQSAVSAPACLAERR